MLIVVCLGSCSLKDGESPANENLENEMQANPDFSWSTTKQVTIEIKGLELPVSISRKLVLSTGEDGVFYSGTQLMNEDFSYAVELPNHIKSVSMQFGTIEKTQDVTGKKITFDYLPADQVNNAGQ